MMDSTYYDQRLFQDFLQVSNKKIGLKYKISNKSKSSNKLNIAKEK